MGKKQIGLENYLNFDSEKFLTKLSPSTLTTAFTNEFMGKQTQIWLESYLK